MFRMWLRRLFHPRALANTAREQYQRGRALAERISVGSELLAESAQHMDKAAARTNRAVEQLELLVAGGLEELIAARPALVDDVMRGLVGAKSADLTPASAQLLDYASGHLGFAAQSGLWFNPAVVVTHAGGEPRLSQVTCRIVEVPFVAAALANLAPGATVADIGAAESTLSLSLASLGYRAYAVDPRGYPLTHPNLTAVEATVAAWVQDDATLDAVVCLSVVEHLGLDAYGEGPAGPTADVDALSRLRRLLKPGGLLALTVPVGEWTVGPTERTYDRPHLDALLNGWTIESEVLVVESPTGEWVRQENPEIGASPGVMLVTARP